jgi:transposase-like protein
MRTKSNKTIPKSRRYGQRAFIESSSSSSDASESMTHHTLRIMDAMHETELMHFRKSLCESGTFSADCWESMAEEWLKWKVRNPLYLVILSPRKAVLKSLEWKKTRFDLTKIRFARWCWASSRLEHQMVWVVKRGKCAVDDRLQRLTLNHRGNAKRMIRFFRKQLHVQKNNKKNDLIWTSIVKQTRQRFREGHFVEKQPIEWTFREDGEVGIVCKETKPSPAPVPVRPPTSSEDEAGEGGGGDENESISPPRPKRRLRSSERVCMNTTRVVVDDSDETQ